MDHDDKERGYPITEAPMMLGFYLRCLACERAVAMLWADVVATWGAGAWTRDIARSLKCAHCGARKGSIMAWSETRPAWERDGPPPSAHPVIGPLASARRRALTASSASPAGL
jgi:hypothetical protein